MRVYKVYISITRLHIGKYGALLEMEMSFFIQTDMFVKVGIQNDK